MPKATTIAVLVNPNTSETEAERRDVQAAAQAIGQQLIVLDVSSDRDIEAAFATFVQRGAGALLVGAGAFLNSQRERLVALAARHALPAMLSACASTVEAGGLMSYGTSITDAYRQAGIYAGRILKGEKPADLPVMQSTKFEFVINLKTAKALGLDPSAAARHRRRGDRMRRREFIAAARRRGGVAARGARAQQAMPVVGFLSSTIAGRRRRTSWPRSARA